MGGRAPALFVALAVLGCGPSGGERADARAPVKPECPGLSECTKTLAASRKTLGECERQARSEIDDLTRQRDQALADRDKALAELDAVRTRLAQSEANLTGCKEESEICEEERETEKTEKEQAKAALESSRATSNARVNDLSRRLYRARQLIQHLDASDRRVQELRSLLSIER